MPNRRDTIIARLQGHAAEWFSDITRFKGLLLACHYFSLPTNTGGVMRPAESFTLRDGQEITFSDVPVAKIVKEVESTIKTRVPEDRRTEIYHKVLTGMPGHKSVPDWDQNTKGTESIYSEPLTPFSMPRDEAISNQDLLDALAPAAGITLSSADSIGIQIAWSDALSDGKYGALMSFARGVKGGRLGDNHHHTIADVPRNYFRDQLMNWILRNEEDGEDEDVKQATRKAICPDLTDAEIEKYAGLISEDQAKRDQEIEAEQKAPETEATRKEMARELVADGRDVSTMAQAMKLIAMNEAVREIDSTIDWQTPKPMGIRRRPGTEVEGSVTTPHWAPLALEDVEPDMEVDRDCDQVRAMIKIFTMSWGSWAPEDFRFALADNMTRDKFTTFLKKRGTDAAQKKSPAYLLSWEFFNRRQKLGLPLEDADPRSDLDMLVEKRDDAKRSDKERAMIATHKEEKKALEKKQNLESDVLSKVHKGQRKARTKVHVEELRALVAAHPWGTPGRSEKLRELAKKQEKEDEAEHEGLKKQDSILQDTHYKEIKVLEEEQKKQLGALKEEERQEALRVKQEREALAETRPSRLNKRSSSSASRGRSKRARN